MASKSAANLQSVLEDYRSSLNDLVFNSKPMINVLTMLAEENETYADGIVRTIRDRIKKVEIKFKVPALYLLDSILKNVGGSYIGILSRYMVEIFTDVFENGDEKIRISMFKLRNTWPQFFPSKFLYELDVSVKRLDPNWPVIEPPSSPASIHVNPRFLVKDEKTEKLASEESLRTAQLRALQKEERLKLEELKIKEQLKRLQEEQIKLRRSRQEEDRLKAADIMRKQQIDRELLLEEQQRQIQLLKNQQEKDLRIVNSSPKKKPQPRELPKNIDPRLAKREVLGSGAENVTEEVIKTKVSAVSNRLDFVNRKEPLEDLRAKIPGKSQNITVTRTIAGISEVQKVSQLPLAASTQASSVNEMPLRRNVNTGITPQLSAMKSEVSKSRDIVLDMNAIKESTPIVIHVNANTIRRIEMQPTERHAVREEDKHGLNVEKDQEKTTENKRESVIVTERTEPPPTKKMKPDEQVDLSVIPMDVDEDIEEEDNEKVATEVVVHSEMPAIEQQQSEMELEAERSMSTLTVSPPEKEDGRFRKRNRSEWRKLMIEKAKLERKKRIPSEKELPREMRVENHEELLNKLNVRLKSGELQKDEYSGLVKQLDLMYEVQKVRETPEKPKENAQKTIESESIENGDNDLENKPVDGGVEVSNVEKTSEDSSVQKTTDKAQTQRQTNEDLIRELTEKRLNAEREERDNERRLRRESNIEQLRAARVKGDRDLRERDMDSRIRKIYEGRGDRRDYDLDTRDRRRYRDRIRDDRGDYARYRSFRDKDRRDKRDRRPPSPLRDGRRRNRLEESSLHKHGRSHERSPRVSPDRRERKDEKTGDRRSVESSRDKRDSIERERRRRRDKKLSEGGEKEHDAGQEKSVEPKETDASINEDAKEPCITAASKEQEGHETATSKEGQVISGEKLGEAEEMKESPASQSSDERSTLEGKRDLISFKIPKKERPVDDDSDQQQGPKMDINETFDVDVRMLSWRNKQEKSRHRDQFTPIYDQGADNRRDTLPLEADLDASRPPGGFRRGRYGGRAQRFESGPHQRQRGGYQRRHGYMNAEPHFDKGGPVYARDYMGKDRMQSQWDDGSRHKLSPMHQPARSKVTDEIYHPGQELRRPEYREPGGLHGSIAGEPGRFPGAGQPGSEVRTIEDSTGYRSGDGARPLRIRRGYGEPDFNPMDQPPPLRGLGPDDLPLPPPDRHIYMDDRPAEFPDRRSDYFNDRSMYDEMRTREQWRDNYRDAYRHSPFDDKRIDAEAEQRSTTFPDDQARKFPAFSGPPGHSDRYAQPGAEPSRSDYHQERRPSPFGHRSVGEQYSKTPASAGFSVTNPLMKMLENVKRNAGQPSSRTTEAVPPQPQASQSFIGVNELFSQLVSTGVITTPNIDNDSRQSTATPPPRLDTQEETIPEINFVMEDLKKRHVSIINTLYVGSQCSSCGLRYPEAERQLYRDHLDWHFRVNRREKENKKSISRPWFNSINQWCDMDDVVDFEEAAKSNVFESEVKQDEKADEVREGSCSVLLGQDDSYCNICFDPFEQFWDETLEEWRYKEAMRFKGQTYHITCYEDMESSDFQSDHDADSNEETNNRMPSDSMKSEVDYEYRIKREGDDTYSDVISVKREPEDFSMRDEDGGHASSYQVCDPGAAGVVVKQEPIDARMDREDSARIPEEFDAKISESVKIKTEPDDEWMTDERGAGTYAHLDANESQAMVEGEGRGPVGKEVLSHTLDRDAPTGALDQDAPTGSLDQGTPTGTLDQDTPTGTLDRDTPTSTLDRDPPTGTLEQDTATGTLDRDTPTGALEQDTPPGTLDKEIPTEVLYCDLPTNVLKDIEDDSPFHIKKIEEEGSPNIAIDGACNRLEDATEKSTETKLEASKRLIADENISIDSITEIKEIKYAKDTNMEFEGKPQS
eukprot:gene7116-7920_t